MMANSLNMCIIVNSRYEKDNEWDSSVYNSFNLVLFYDRVFWSVPEQHRATASYNR